ncbi:MAG TPA: ATP-binding protein [Blastocatellia bacterium]|nr:ATP-binding protein [Blastocatellia bacterium]
MTPTLPLIGSWFVQPPPAPAILSPFDILKLVGFATGAALYLYLCWMLYRRYGLRRVERSLFILGLSIGLQHLGNFASVIYILIVGKMGGPWLKSFNVVAYVALAFLPPSLIHSHFRAWEWFDKRAPRQFFKPLIIAGYLPLAVLPWVVFKLWEEPYRLPIDKLEPLMLPFILWLVLIFIECALIDWVLANRLEAARERRFFEVFGASLLMIGILFLVTYVFGARNWGMLGRYLDLISYLSSIAPAAIVAYYIYRYRYLELVIRQSFVYATLAALVMIVYVYGIRRLGTALEGRGYGANAPGAIEALLILVVIFLASPLRRLTDSYLQRLFAREVGLYRELVAQVGSAASSYGELVHFVQFTEQRLFEALELSEVRIVPSNSAPSDAAEVVRIAEERELTEIEDGALLNRLNALACYSLWREGRVVGLLIVRGEPRSLTAEKREVLMVLAGHLAVAIESCQLLEEKVKLERELAERERLASLGQMAATVAHEIKNPLSAIKSIAQVMREDEQISGEYGRDLDLITGEVDRLNRSVSQLLSFSRPAVVASSPASLREIVESVLALTRAETEAHGVKVSLKLSADPQLDGESAAALKEILLNLVLNALQALRPGGELEIESRLNDSNQLYLAVTDDGLGIPTTIQEKIFEPFFTTKQRGTGLGLAIVARRTRELAGAIKLTSPVIDGRGTRFELDLPV